MKLIASMIVRNELDRYLKANIEHLLAFCDEIRVVDDGSSENWWDGDERVQVEWLKQPDGYPYSAFYTHEGQARQKLLEWTMQGNPTHILAIDADEFVADGQYLRAQMEAREGTGVWKLEMTEVWEAGEDWLSIRWDGDWKPRPIGIAYAVPHDYYSDRQKRRHWRMNDMALACGRTPLYVTMVGNRTITDPVTPILHFGWANPNERDARYQRYVTHDGGQFHKNKHLDSIMWGPDQVETRLMPWPVMLDKATILSRVHR